MGAVRGHHARRWIIVVTTLIIASLTASSPTMAASARSSNPLSPLPWGREIPIYGNGSVFTSLSCAARGYCTAVGYWVENYLPGDNQGFILNETHGRWGLPFNVPGLHADQLPGSIVLSVSCRAKGTCTAVGLAGGPFSDGSAAFVIDEKRGVWGKVRPEPGPGSLAMGTNGSQSVESVSCAAPGDCAAVGQYETSAGQEQGFVVDERNGVWRAAQDVPGLATLSGGGMASVDVVSCTAVGDCSADGSWYDGQVLHGFVVGESHGTWGNAAGIQGVSSLQWPARDFGQPPIALSCAAPGDCAAVGADGTNRHIGGFVVDESRGIWGTAAPIPGLASLNTGNNASVNAISCWAVGSCDAVGTYVGQIQGGGFLAEERAGHWHSARMIPGLAAITGDGYVLPTTISCDATGDCAAGGIYGGGNNFVLATLRGVWHDAATIRNGGGQTTEISCVAGEHCVVATDAYKGEDLEVAPGPVLARR
jgi:hypothetical protein